MRNWLSGINISMVNTFIHTKACVYIENGSNRCSPADKTVDFSLAECSITKGNGDYCLHYM